MDALGGVVGRENLLVLAVCPTEVTGAFEAVIAESCARGRPPFVMVLGDGSASVPPAGDWSGARLAALREREVRAAMAQHGLARERLVMAGLFDGTIPGEGPVFEAIVRAVVLVMWARDCGVVITRGDMGTRVAGAVAQANGVGVVVYPG